MEQFQQLWSYVCSYVYAQNQIITIATYLHYATLVNVRKWLTKLCKNFANSS